MNIFDIVIIFILIIFFITGWKRGVIKEIVSLVGIILVFIISFLLKDKLGNFLCLNLPFISFKGSIKGIISLNLLFYQVLAFIILFCLLLTVYELLLKLSKWLQKIVNMTIILILPSKILGGLLSFIKGYIILFCIFILLIIPLNNNELIKESTLMNFILYKTPVLSNNTNKLTKSVNDIYSLGKDVTKKKITKKEANKNTLDILLKYKIIDKELVKKLIENKKIDNYMEGE